MQMDCKEYTIFPAPGDNLSQEFRRELVDLLKNIFDSILFIRDRIFFMVAETLNTFKNGSS